jgi:tetratricopeptide (TPR) repeat protein
MNEFLMQLPAIVIAIFALVYAIRAHKLNLHINNEHLLYDHKMQSSKGVLYAISNLMNCIQNGFYLFEDLIANNERTKDNEELLDAANEIDEAADELPITNVTIVRLARNTRPVYAIPDNMLESLGVPKEPSWMSAYRHDMSTVAAKVNRGKLYNSVGAAKKALEYLESAYQSDPHASGLEYELPYAYNELKQYDKAIAVLNAAVKNKPDNEMFYRELGYSYSGKGDSNRAIQSYMKGIEICGECNFGAKAEMAWNLAVVYRNLKNDEEFKKWGQNAKAWAPKDSDLYKTLMNTTFDKPR